MKKRIIFVLIVILIFSATIISRLIFLQLINYEYWRALAQGQQKDFIEFQGERGNVFFQNMTNLAINKNFPFVYANPQEIKNKMETSEILSLILDLDKNYLLEKLANNNSFVLIKQKLNENELNSLKELNIPGIYLNQESLRHYPFDNLASHVIGFLSYDGQGQYGIEGYYDQNLKGKQRAAELEKAPGYFFSPLENLASADLSYLALKGDDLVLTINYDIQFMAEKILEKAKENLEFESGEIIVMDPNSGKILALANLPNFNPNLYSKVTDMSVFQNSSIQKVFEPGSVFKPITMAAALNEGKITPDTKFIDEGFVKIGDHTIFNFANRTWGERTMTEVLQYSINTGAVFVQKQLGNELFLKYIEKFGFFDKTGIDLQGEIFSKNQELKKGYEINFATASFGQGIEITSIQLARAFAAIANGGKLVRPYVVDKIIKNDKVIEIKPEIQSFSVISEKTASQLTLMLINVVEKGYGKEAKVPGYYIAGKTGTAQVSWSNLGINKKGYSEKTIQSFIGFGPALNPKFLILVKLYNPKTKTAEYSAAPLFGELAKYIINLWHIPPDYE